jgi:hypothetical protein
LVEIFLTGSFLAMFLSARPHFETMSISLFHTSGMPLMTTGTSSSLHPISFWSSDDCLKYPIAPFSPLR